MILTFEALEHFLVDKSVRERGRERGTSNEKATSGSEFERKLGGEQVADVVVAPAARLSHQFPVTEVDLSISVCLRAEQIVRMVGVKKDDDCW